MALMVIVGVGTLVLTVFFVAEEGSESKAEA